MSLLKTTLDTATRTGRELLDRSLDRQVRVAVTGLARSGKTAFITALVHQLEHAASDASLPLLQVARDGRLLGAKRVPQSNPNIPTFPYEAGMRALQGDPPAWPEPTRGIAELRLALRHRPAGSLRKRLGDTATLYVDIVDYPGEWLLDLPLLALDYRGWSEQMRAWLERNALHERAAGWLNPAQRANQRFEEATAATLSAAYKQFLLECREQLGLSFIQPGRFILEGEYVGAPMMRFVPWVWEQPQGEASAGTLYAAFAERFEHYKEHLVRAFYRDHFASFDRQIVLVDCLDALNGGALRFDDTRHALATILGSFRYGSSSWWRRLFSARIDRLLFAASKADHVTPDQQANLVSLLQHVVQEGHRSARFEGIVTDCVAMASVRATQAGRSVHEGRDIEVLKGRLLDGTQITVNPGSVPASPPDAAWWSARNAAFDAFAPPQLAPHRAMPHIRVDAALEFLLGDKLAR